MPAIRCRIAATPTAELVLRDLDARGVIAADHLMVVGSEIQLTLDDLEIAAIESAGLTVIRGSSLRILPGRDESRDGTGGLDLLSGFVSGYLDGPEVAARLATLVAMYPTRCTLTTLPFPTSGYDGSLAAAVGPGTVQLLRITNDPTTHSRPGFLLIGGTHAREWMNPLIALEFAEQLLSNVDPASVDPTIVAITRIVTLGDVFIIPVLNPDGFTFSVHDDAGWRKNRRPNPAAPGCPGVDNNRNYEVYFGGAGSSAMPCLESYHGAAAMSEAENQNVRTVLEQFPNILVGVDAHSFGQQILRPGPAGGSFISSLPVSAADHAIYTALETTLGTAIQSVNGAVYSTGSTSNHAGTSDEYMFFGHRVFGFNTECGTDFQPPWATAMPVITEVVTGLRALAAATVDLVTTTPTPLAVVQCIDRTGSMVAFGYDEVARANAKRFVDLLSLGDSTAVVSFADPSPDPLATPEADRAQVEVAMTLLNDPGDAAPIRAAIDSIAFGGWTPIGAGLKLSAALLAGAAPPTAVLLLSDGFENRSPTVAATLPMLPAGLRVFTVALGPAADAVLLQQISTSTGGTFLLSPTALDLHQVYNEMRAGITDEGMLLNVVVPSGADQFIDVEPAADRLTVSVSTVGSQDRLDLGPLVQPGVSRGLPGLVGRASDGVRLSAAAEVVLVAPSGRAVRIDDWGVRVVSGDGYRLISVERPVPGRWRIATSRGRGPQVIAAFLASPLRVDVDVPTLVKAGGGAELRARAWFDRVPLGPVRTAARSQLLGRVKLPGDEGQPIDLDRLDPAALAKLRRPRLGRPLRWVDTVIPVLPHGFSRVSVEVSGLLPGGAPFRRVAQRALRAV